jgi:hypothetical protein
MSVSVHILPVPAAKPRRGLAAALGFAVLVCVIFVAGFAAPYFTLNEERFAGYWPHRWWLLVHIAAGIVATFTGPVQLWLGLNDRRMTTHRTLGVVYMASIAIGAPTGLYLAFNTEHGVVAGAGLAGLSVAWALTTGMAYLAVRRHLYDQHKEWMIRSFVVTLAFVNARLGVGFGMAAGITDFDTAFAMAIWASWSVPLLATEAILQGRKIFSVRT